MCMFNPSNLGLRFQKISRESPNSTIEDVWGNKITFSQLFAEATKLASELLSVLGPEKRHVCIESRKQPRTLVLVVTCWLLNWSYTFFDSRQPSERINQIIDISKASVIASTEGERYDSSFKLLNLKREIDFKFKFFFSEKVKYSFSEKTSYIMFTSGSTGIPKGVLIADYQVERLVDWLIQMFGIENSDVLTGVNPWYFDNSVFDIHIPLLSGANLVICDTDDSSKGLAWIERIAQRSPTIWFSVPSLLIFLQSIGSFKEERIKSLRLIIFGGEAYPKKLLNDLMLDQGKKTHYFSVYGPTETTCICSVTEVSTKEMESESKYISLGNFPSFFMTSLHNTYELSSGEIAGELMLGGVNVSSGYAKVENNTGRFIEIANEDGSLTNYYLTGDLVYFDQSLKKYCFLGRKDNQIKRSGIRIELEEIESRLEKVSGTVVIADYQSDRFFDLCIVFLKTDRVTEEFMERSCKESLSSFMLPRKVIGVNEIPLNANGKKDRRVLKEQLRRLIGDLNG